VAKWLLAKKLSIVFATNAMIKIAKSNLAKTKKILNAGFKDIALSVSKRNAKEGNVILE
jgi:hypothetical protein